MKTINLTEYFNTTKKSYYFFDGLFLKEKETKYNILKSNAISENSYRTERLKDIVKNDNIKILLDYFQCNNVDKNNKIKYETILSKVYYCSYYHNQTELISLIDELKILIEENNIFKPMFILFKIFAMLNFGHKMSELKQELDEDLKYLMLFKKKYFSEELYYLYKIILYYFGINKDLKELEQLAEKYVEFNWIYYHLRASKHYLEYNNYDALVYYNAVLEYYKNNNNMNRLFRTSANIAAIYNTMDKYALAIKQCSTLIEYAYSSRNDKWISAMTQHYLYEHFMMGNYFEIVNFFEIIVFDMKNINRISAIICILAAYKIGNITRANFIIDNNKEDDNVRIILDYINGDRLNINLLKELYPSDYMCNIVEKIIKDK